MDIPTYIHTYIDKDIDMCIEIDTDRYRYLYLLTLSLDPGAIPADCFRSEPAKLAAASGVLFVVISGLPR